MRWLPLALLLGGCVEGYWEMRPLDEWEQGAVSAAIDEYADQRGVVECPEIDPRRVRIRTGTVPDVTALCSQPPEYPVLACVSTINLHAFDVPARAYMRIADGLDDRAYVSLLVHEGLHVLARCDGRGDPYHLDADLWDGIEPDAVTRYLGEP